jgi:hypothetical protein
VFQKFKFWEKTDDVLEPGAKNTWIDAFGLDKPTATGMREIIEEMCSLPVDASKTPRITAKVWRLLTDQTGVIFEAAPDTVSATVHPDGTIDIRGHDISDGPLPGTENNTKVRYPRYLCNSSITTWNTKAFAITFTVLGDERPVGIAKSGLGYPEDLEERTQDKKFTNKYRHNALHFLDADGKPVEENPVTASNIDNTVNALEGYNDTLNTLAGRRLLRVCRPELVGVVQVTGVTFRYSVGQRITQLTGGAGLPTITVAGLVVGVTQDFEKQVTILEVANV